MVNLVKTNVSELHQTARLNSAIVNPELRINHFRYFWAARPSTFIYLIWKWWVTLQIIKRCPEAVVWHGLDSLVKLNVLILWDQGAQIIWTWYLNWFNIIGCGDIYVEILWSGSCKTASAEYQSSQIHLFIDELGNQNFSNFIAWVPTHLFKVKASKSTHYS